MRRVFNIVKASVPALCVLAALAGSGAASAGNQKEEAIADSVRLALSNAIKDARPPRPTFKDEAARLLCGTQCLYRWLRREVGARILVTAPAGRLRGERQGRQQPEGGDDHHGHTAARGLRRPVPD